MPSTQRCLTVLLLLLLLSPLPRRADALQLEVLSWSGHGRSTLDTAAVGSCAQCGVLCHQRQTDCLAVACSADAGQCQLLGEPSEAESVTEESTVTVLTTAETEWATEETEWATEETEWATEETEWATEETEWATEETEWATGETESITEPLCDTNWEEFAGACFIVQTEKMQYEAAKEHCRGLRSGLSPSADLASIHSAAENAFLQQLVGNQSVWIGLEHAALPEEGDRDFRWVDGTALDFSHWRHGQPNDPATQPLSVMASSAGLLWLDYRVGDSMPTYRQLCKYTP